MCQLISDSDCESTQRHLDRHTIQSYPQHKNLTLNWTKKNNATFKVNMKQHSQPIFNFNNLKQTKKPSETSLTPTFEEAFVQKVEAEGQVHPREHLDILQW